jgi:hypothetical protein
VNKPLINLALRGYEGRVRKYTDQLISQLNANAGKAINACKWFNFFSFDIMGDMAFGESFDMVASGKEVSKTLLLLKVHFSARVYLTSRSIL